MDNLNKLDRSVIIALAKKAGIDASVSNTNTPYVNALGKSVPVEWLEKFSELILENSNGYKSGVKDFL